MFQGCALRWETGRAFGPGMLFSALRCTPSRKHHISRRWPAYGVSVAESQTTVGWVERSEPHQQETRRVWCGSLRSTHPTDASATETTETWASGPRWTASTPCCRREDRRRGSGGCSCRRRRACPRRLRCRPARRRWRGRPLWPGLPVPASVRVASRRRVDDLDLVVVGVGHVELALVVGDAQRVLQPDLGPRAVDVAEGEQPGGGQLRRADHACRTVAVRVERDGPDRAALAVGHVEPRGRRRPGRWAGRTSEARADRTPGGSSGPSTMSSRPLPA